MSGEINLNSGRILKAESGCLQDQPRVIEGVAYFTFEVGWNLAGLEVASNLPGDVECSVDQDPWTVREAGGARVRMFIGQS
jgi:hypothetical protein